MNAMQFAHAAKPHRGTPMNDDTSIPVFGVTRFRNMHASEDNPIRDGTFVRVVSPPTRTRTGVYEMTDGKGDFWKTSAEFLVDVPDTPAPVIPAAVRAVEEILTDLNSRGGFDDWFGDIVEDLKVEIRAEMARHITDAYAERDKAARELIFACRGVLYGGGAFDKARARLEAAMGGEA